MTERRKLEQPSNPCNLSVDILCAATTLVTLRVDLSNVMTGTTLGDGLEFTYEKLGLKLTKHSPI